MHTTSISLLESLRDGAAQEAWRRFVWLYTPLLLDWSRRLKLSEPDSADLIQDVFTTLVAKLPEFRYRPGGGFRHWLHTVLKNRYRDWQRRRMAVSFQTGHSETLSRAVGTDDSDIPELDQADYERQLVRRTLDSIRPEFQPATWRAFWEHGSQGRPAAEVARELGQTVGAIYAAKFRGRTRVRQELQGLLE